MSGFELSLDGKPETPAFAVTPPGAKRGVVVIHEVYGRQPEIDRVVERFGASGWAAIAPDLFAWAPQAICIMRAMASVVRGEGAPFEQVRRARAWLMDKTGLPGDKIGVIGFCFGGAFALAIGREFAAVSTNYGDVPRQERLRGLPPTIGCYGAKDRIFAGKAVELKDKLEALRVPVETHLFEEVGHSFLTDGNHPIGFMLAKPLMGIVPYNPAVAEEGWRRIFAFFDRYLPA
jgi:carboxymethylenebutenolidase